MIFGNNSKDETNRNCVFYNKSWIATRFYKQVKSFFSGNAIDFSIKYNFTKTKNNSE